MKKVRIQYAPIFACLVSRHSKKIAIFFKVWLKDHFGPKHTSAWGTIRPKEYFGSNNTSARCLLQPGNTSAWKYFSPEILQPETTLAQYTSARGPHFKRVIFNQLGPSIGLGGVFKPWLSTLLGLEKNWKICPTKAKNQSDQKKYYYMMEKGFSSVDQSGSGLLTDIISLIFISQHFQSRLLLEIA